jgi:uncharacterized protein DUF4266
MQILRVLCACLLATPLLALAGCAAVGAGDRAIRARPEMAVDAYRVDMTFDEGLYRSKEAATGARRLVPGVCGCK